eukprot:COSAG01_NODE_33572_length_562_cov_0.747300_1_plen_75_part_10
MQKLDQNFPAIDEPSDAMIDLAISIMKSVLFLEHPPRARTKDSVKIGNLQSIGPAPAARQQAAVGLTRGPLRLSN